MRRIRGPIVATILAVILAAPLPALADHEAAPEGKRQRPDRIGLLIQHRADLALTDDQVAQLESVRQRYGEQNQAIREQIRGIAGERPKESENLSKEERRAAREKRHEELLAEHPELGPLHEQLKANSKAAHEEVLGILTPEQQKKVQQMVSERRGKSGGRRGAASGGGTD
jgi:Spy/CpxP family protein refolding chaperone